MRITGQIRHGTGDSWGSVTRSKSGTIHLPGRLCILFRPRHQHPGDRGNDFLLGRQPRSLQMAALEKHDAARLLLVRPHIRLVDRYCEYHKALPANVMRA